MKRKIIEIDEAACNGCGLCVGACHEGAIGLVGGKARLLRDDYCDGLGDCLPMCPTGAITFVEREAAAYDEAAVQARRAQAGGGAPAGDSAAPALGCPGARPETLRSQTAPVSGGCPGARSQALRARSDEAAEGPNEGGQNIARPSELASWPVEIKLVPVQAPYFAGAHLLVAADCTAFAYADFHRDFMRGRVTLIGCPKLDGVDYAEKLAAILTGNDVASVTVARMEVPCCGGLEQAARVAVARSGKDIPFNVAVISTQGELLERR